MSHQFLLFEDRPGIVLVTVQSELIQLPEIHVSEFLSFEFAAYDALAAIAPHTRLCTEKPTKTTTFHTTLGGCFQQVEIFHVPVQKNGTGTWISLSRLDKSHTSGVIDDFVETLNLKATS